MWVERRPFNIRARGKESIEFFKGGSSGGGRWTVFPEKEKLIVTQASVTDRPLSYDDIYFAEI